LVLVAVAVVLEQLVVTLEENIAVQYKEQAVVADRDMSAALPDRVTVLVLLVAYLLLVVQTAGPGVLMAVLLHISQGALPEQQ
jgi:hypothetical protein